VDNSVKFRLVGATVVLLVGVVILPPLLKAPPPELVIEDYIPPQPSQITPDKAELQRQDWTIGDVLANEEEPDLTDLRPHETDLDNPQQASDDGQLAQTLASTKTSSQATQTAEETLAKKVAKTSQKNGSQTQSAVSKPVDIAFDQQGVPVAWSIQVASFSNNENAKRLEAQLIKKGYKAQIRTTPDSKLTRVYVGPSMDKKGLEKDKQLIENQFKLTSQIVRYRPGE
jgi:DedD protein